MWSRINKRTQMFLQPKTDCTNFSPFWTVIASKKLSSSLFFGGENIQMMLEFWKKEETELKDRHCSGSTAAVVNDGVVKQNLTQSLCYSKSVKCKSLKRSRGWLLSKNFWIFYLTFSISVAHKGGILGIVVFQWNETHILLRKTKRNQEVFARRIASFKV